MWLRVAFPHSDISDIQLHTYPTHQAVQFGEEQSPVHGHGTEYWGRGPTTKTSRRKVPTYCASRPQWDAEGGVQGVGERGLGLSRDRQVVELRLARGTKVGTLR